MQVLIVEDEALVAMEIESALKKEGFEVCAIVDNAQEALQKVKECSPDVILLDIYLQGDMDGVEICQRIKASYDIPIIYLTAYSDKKTLEEAIACEPEGYLIKPFRRAELFAALKLTLTKRASKALIPICEDIYYDKSSYEVVRGEERILLTKKEAELLELLLERKGEVIGFEELEAAIWPKASVSDATRRTLIHRLRSKLFGKCLKTVTGIGCMIG